MSKIKHAPKFYVRFCTKAVNFPGNFRVYPGSIYGRYTENGKPVFWVCDNYIALSGKLTIHVYNGEYWKICPVDPDHPCYKWVKSAINQLGMIPKVDRENLSHDTVEDMMKTYSRHKKGNGSRINTNQINQPLRWNEVTEEAHWYGKGNASVVASNIR